MIASMTGFAAVTRPVKGGTINFEIKSVNSRFLDISFKLPEDLRALEMPLRELLSRELSRGKVECRAGWVLGQDTRNEAIDEGRLHSLVGLARQVAALLPQSAPLSVAEILRWPGIIQESSQDIAALLPEYLALANEAVAEFKESRLREGVRLTGLIQDRMATMRQLVDCAEPLIPEAQQAYAEKARTKLLEVMGTGDDDRIRQELTLYAVRTDVAEELGRLKVHLDEVERVLTAFGPAGKRLDFLMQELNREANTLGSKSVSGEVSATAMELKLLIEQIREQVQNIE